jgi:hypothetical protein
VKIFSRLLWVVSLYLLGASACAGMLPALPTPEPSATPQPSLQPSATIVWFPPTSTATRVPPRLTTPTPDQHPGRGALLLSDTFTVHAGWQTGVNDNGSMAFGKQELSLVVSQPKGSLASLRLGPELDNYYLEITASPSLCRGADAYGLLLRASNSENAYRFLATCQGLVRLERVKGGRILPLQDWTPGGQTPGAPLDVRFGVWAYNNEIRFFVNDMYVFSINDPVWRSGKIGVFARSAGDTAVTVSFSQLEVYGLEVAPTSTPQGTPTRTAARKPTNG